MEPKQKQNKTKTSSLVQIQAAVGLAQVDPPRRHDDQAVAVGFIVDRVDVEVHRFRRRRRSGRRFVRGRALRHPAVSWISIRFFHILSI